MIYMDDSNTTGVRVNEVSILQKIYILALHHTGITNGVTGGAGGE